MHAEQAYMFRHAVLRDAAYQLHLPAERAKLHALALDIIEQAHQGKDAELDALAAELADHALQAAAAARDQKRRALLQRELQWLLRALEHDERTYRYAERVARGRRVAQHAQATDADRVLALDHVSRAMNNIGNMDGALAASQEAVAIAEASGSASLIAMAKVKLQGDLLQCGHTEASRRILAEAVSQARVGGDSEVLTSALLSHAQALMFDGKIADATLVLAELRPILACVPKPRLLALFRYLEAMREMNRAAGDLSDAVAEVTRARAYLRSLGQRDIEATLVFNLGVRFAERGQPEEAAKHYGEALRLSEEIGSRAWRATLLSNLGNVRRYMETRYLDALVCYQEALATAEESGQQGQAQTAYSLICELLTTLGRFDEAEAALARATALAQRRGGEGAKQLYRQTVLLLLERRKFVEAEQTCLRWAADASEPEEKSRAWCELSSLWLRLGRLGQAQAALDRAVNLCASALWPTYGIQAHAARGKLNMLLDEKDAAASDFAYAGAMAARAKLGNSRSTGILLPNFHRAAYDLCALPGAPSADDVDRLERLFEEYRASGNRGDLRLSITHARALQAAGEILAEARRALQAGEPVALFRGVLPSRLEPQTRLALIEHMRETRPDQYAAFKQLRPALLGRMLEGTSGLPMPDWRSKNLPLVASQRD